MIFSSLTHISICNLMAVVPPHLNFFYLHAQNIMALRVHLVERNSDFSASVITFTALFRVYTSHLHCKWLGND